MAEVERTCVVCRKSGDKGTLVRFVLLRDEEVAKSRGGGNRGGGNAVKMDFYGTEPGRGAYCHLHPRCLTQRSLVTKLLFSLRRVKSKKQAAGECAEVDVGTVIESALSKIGEDSLSEDEAVRYAAVREICRKEDRKEELRKPKIRL